jgi:hypothetical protein
MHQKGLILVVLAMVVKMSESIWCYDCDSSADFSCSEFWDPSLDVNGQYYSDCGTVYDSNYCVKMTGIFDGKLGTKRFCSSRDWGDYCEYIKRPGDPREYRSCVFTCSDHGCNGADLATTKTFLIILICIVISSFI